MTETAGDDLETIENNVRRHAAPGESDAKLLQKEDNHEASEERSFVLLILARKYGILAF